MGADGKLTQEERERHHLKGPLLLLRPHIDLPAPTVATLGTPNLL